MKLKYKDIPRIKEELMKEQNNICYICNRDLSRLKPRDRCLDHNHKTGRIRGVLCRGCNSMEGKVFRVFQRVGLEKAGVRYEFLLNGLMDYYINPPKTTYIHPKFKEKKVKK